MSEATLLHAASARWRPADPAPDTGDALPEERRRRLAPADALAVGLALQVVRAAGLPVPLDRPRRLAIAFAAESVPRGARAAFLAGPPPPGLGSPTMFLHTSANFPPAQLAIALGCRGPSATFVGGVDALERGLSWLAEGAADEAIVFGARRVEDGIDAIAVLLGRNRGAEPARIAVERDRKHAAEPGELAALDRLLAPVERPIPLGGSLWLRPSR